MLECIGICLYSREILSEYRKDVKFVLILKDLFLQNYHYTGWLIKNLLTIFADNWSKFLYLKTLDIFDLGMREFHKNLKFL